MKSHQPVRYLQLRVVLRSLSLRDWYQPYVLVLILHRDEKGHHLYRPFFFLFCCGQYFVSPWQRRNEGCLTRVHQPVRHLRIDERRVSWLHDQYPYSFLTCRTPASRSDEVSPSNPVISTASFTLLSLILITHESGLLEFINLFD